MTKVIEIRMAGFLNKGAAMMLIAAAQKLRSAFPGAIVLVKAGNPVPFEPRARQGLWHRAEWRHFGIDLAHVLNFVPERRRRRYGFITEREVDVVIDAAGMAYSDHWGPQHTVDLAHRARRWSRQGKRLVLLPQAFGPFTNPEIRAAIREVADYATLIFARDPVSYNHLIEIVGERPSIRRAPDFTNLLKPTTPTSFDIADPRFCIVPNMRMLDKTGEEQSASYLSFLERCAMHLLERNLRPFFLIHEAKGDLEIAERVNRALEVPIPVLVVEDALEAKGILGSCQAVIGSRYHALISALSQAVPSIGTGWSHKYRLLFEDYGCPEALTTVNLSNDELSEKLKLITEPDRSAELSHRLEKPAKRLKAEANQMWQSVIEELRS